MIGKTNELADLRSEEILTNKRRKRQRMLKFVDIVAIGSSATWILLFLVFSYQVNSQPESQGTRKGTPASFLVMLGSVVISFAFTILHIALNVSETTEINSLINSLTEKNVDNHLPALTYFDELTSETLNKIPKGKRHPSWLKNLVDALTTIIVTNPDSALKYNAAELLVNVQMQSSCLMISGVQSLERLSVLHRRRLMINWNA